MKKNIKKLIEELITAHEKNTKIVDAFGNGLILLEDRVHKLEKRLNLETTERKEY